MKLYDGEILKKARKAQELTQADVCKILGIGRRQISQMENGVFDGGLKYFLKYLSLLNLKIDIIKGTSGWVNDDEYSYIPDDKNYPENEERATYQSSSAAIAKKKPAVLPGMDELDSLVDLLFKNSGDSNDK
ncbi:helix-turn-helix domain-containing protein [Pseudoalteromonas sp. N1230-9]|uniref:helix-turn-helix transcriptional regulator n=1 Tax=Pseudoalteromonas sp. N1230-9 TaxID=2907156 RepID=UPI002B284DEF|nr:helix-turn-helix domain-containing protein [Pseudoalteromonas sp. N1230-9]